MPRISQTRAFVSLKKMLFWNDEVCRSLTKSNDNGVDSTSIVDYLSYYFYLCRALIEKESASTNKQCKMT